MAKKHEVVTVRVDDGDWERALEDISAGVAQLKQVEARVVETALRNGVGVTAIADAIGVDPRWVKRRLRALGLEVSDVVPQRERKAPKPKAAKAASGRKQAAAAKNAPKRIKVVSATKPSRAIKGRA